jgi:hypothetical protein
MEVNVRGMNCLWTELSHMQVGRGDGGVAEICGGPVNGLYVARKHVVVDLTRTVAIEEGIPVSMI